MKVSTKWLNEYVSVNDIEPQVLAEKIERTAVEIDAAGRREDGMKKIVVGHTLSVVDHPDSDHLHICQVDVGEAEPFQIVCGAPNVAADQKVIVALPNSRIADNIKIKKGKMRGVVSQGMICGLQEIGFPDSVVPKEFADGIYVLPEDAVAGEPVFGYLGMDELVLELDLTPNRADLMSMRGVAHEIAAIYGREVKLTHPELKDMSDEKIADFVDVTADETLAPTYLMRAIKDVKIAPSPMWLQNRLWNAGIRPVNNVVDVTNYILLDYGQPLHAFDYAKLAGKEIFVRLAQEGEKLITLDGEERELEPTDMVIADANGPIALAGVMGGQSTEVDDQTTTILLEAAVFNSSLVRKTARREVLHSESSARFERGINIATVKEAIDAAAALIAELSGGQVVAEMAQATFKEPEDTIVKVTLKRINDVLGTDFDAATVEKIFIDLGFGVVQTDGEFTVTVPPRRWDIKIAADLLEEVARLYGYDNLPTTLPVAEMTPGHYTDLQMMVRSARELLEAAGLSQAISYSLVSAEKAQRFLMEPTETTELVFPMTSERTTLRSNLISGLLDDLAYNTARKVENIAMYEQGKVFYKKAGEDRPREVEHVAGAMTGLFKAENWHDAKQPVDFYIAKGVVEHLLSKLGLEKGISFKASQAYPEMHPGRTADIFLGEEYIGFIGEIHPNIAQEYRLQRTYVFELDLEKMVAVKPKQEQYVPVSKFPEVKRDIALLVAEDVTNADLVDCIKANGGAYLADVEIFDVYAGDKIADGFKSLAYKLVFRNAQATLVDEDINKAVEKVIKNLQEKFAAEVR
ncbi:phenylalanine--tRNA ligase subunit beta [Ligilactobacillus ceti]|uniref:Phenylalanine--tRNA ligase beta subunit n=1 Tax=Ligilactobacillus ceti DSM 22408 TaxID=1122146 RepID=A0A0R2KHC8_9LACO|nr:phenylalanine--tRNA ligase subunit beta [Ligilactobacillus ceti]KRN88753.1 phenylalanyl-tRNA synthetase subunit beta [Ligilactobacillus ceti DSM 22408]